MKYLPIILVLLSLLTLPVQAVQVEAPMVPSSGEEFMPEKTDSLGEALMEMLETLFSQLRPLSAPAAETGAQVLAASLLLSVVSVWEGRSSLPVKPVRALAGCALLLGSSKSMLQLAADTIQELTDYGKLLFPVMTTAMAAQGGVTTSAALYAGTMILDTVLASLISGVMLPAVSGFLALGVGFAVTGEDILKRMRDFVRNGIAWFLKALLTAFTAYMSITGVVSGTTDTAALKATKVTISTVVPVVGSVLSDASEAVLVSTGIVRNAAGIYGILAILAVFLVPFLEIGAQYMVLKATASLCMILDAGGLREVVEDVSTAMGLLLAMTGTVCLLLLISTVCFLKGVG